MNNKHTHETQQRITVFFGYALFVAAVIAVCITVAAWGSLMNPGDQPFGVVSMLLSFIVAALIPPFVGYVVGDRATRPPSKLVHHYNGVLFGILGMWLSLAVASSSALIDITGLSIHVPLFVRDYAPTIVAVIILVCLGIVYGRSTNHQVAILSFKPYQGLFAAVVVWLFIASGWATASGIWYGADYASTLAVLLLPLAMVVGIIVFGAWLIGARNGSWRLRYMKSLVSISFATIAMSVVSFLSSFLPIPLVATIALVAAIATWIVWVVIFRRFPAIQG